ncbi:MAG: hypothetical protein IT533_01365 [Hyphomicrobiales bacterium]|mgnify:FL=1|jgi:hypothetical protein|nr:hypothetical protein [Hyphomicrobiales bacterium]
MPRYFFDTYDAGQLHSDDHGIVCETRAELRENAVNSLPEIARERLPNGDNHVFTVKVRDDTGSAIFEASLIFESRWLDGE